MINSELRNSSLGMMKDRSLIKALPKEAWLTASFVMISAILLDNCCFNTTSTRAWTVSTGRQWLPKNDTFSLMSTSTAIVSARGLLLSCLPGLLTVMCSGNFS